MQYRWIIPTKEKSTFLNLIALLGHVDFLTKLSRSIPPGEGALVVVDALKCIQDNHQLIIFSLRKRF